MRKAYVATALVLAAAASLQPAMALTSVDPVVGINNIGAWLFLLAAGLIPLIFLIKGLQAMAQGERYGHHITGLLVGLGICLAGYTIMTRYGGGA